MKGAHRIIVQNKRIRYDFEVRRNITVIRGDSATGKTALVDMIREYYENGSASGIELACDKECTVLEGRAWTVQLAMMQDSIVFIDEGNGFVGSDAFAAVVQDTDNYYVIVTREGIPSLPYSVDEIYGIRNSGKYGTLKRTYNEFYHLYRSADYKQEVRPERVVTEDSNSGHQFFQAVCGKSGIGCVSAGGKSNIFRTVLGQAEVKILEHPEDYIESRDYFSWERFFTALLVRDTKDTHLRYVKRHLNPAYLQERVQNKILDVMDRVHLG